MSGRRHIVDSDDDDDREDDAPEMAEEGVDDDEDDDFQHASDDEGGDEKDKPYRIRSRIVPSSLRGLRACLLCALVKTADQFEADGLVIVSRYYHFYFFSYSGVTIVTSYYACGVIELPCSIVRRRHSMV